MSKHNFYWYEMKHDNEDSFKHGIYGLFNYNTYFIKNAMVKKNKNMILQYYVCRLRHQLITVLHECTHITLFQFR